MNMSQRDRRAVKLGVAAAVVLGGYFGVVEPLQARYQRLVDWHQAAAEKIARNVEERQRLSVREKEVKECEEKAGPLLVERTYSEQITAVGSRIMAAANESQVQIQGAVPSPPTPWTDAWAAKGETSGGPQLDQATITIDAQTAWENAFKFVAALYRTEGILSVEQLDLSGDAKGGQLKLHLVVSVLMKASAEGKR
jgi:hypothetical protein